MKLACNFKVFLVIRLTVEHFEVHEVVCDHGAIP
jgi:hypothetical protein